MNPSNEYPEPSPDRGANATQTLDPTDHDEEKSFASSTSCSGTTVNEESLDEPQLKSIWNGWTGVVVMTFGVVLPAVLLSSVGGACYDRITLLLLRSPIETLAQIILATMIPVTNLDVWNALCKSDCRGSIRRGVATGIAIGTSAVVFLTTIVAVILHYPTLSSDGTRHGLEFLIISSISLLSCLVSVYLARRQINTRILKSSKMRAVGFAAFGVALSAGLLLLSEARPVCLRVAETMALSEDKETSEKGMKFLRWLTPERELKMECSNSKAGGIAGLFARLDTATCRQLYFKVTGQPFRDDKAVNYASMSDDYLKRHVVGEPVVGLDLHRSAMQGQVNPRTVSSTIYWTFVFKNKTYESQEARAQIEIPQGSAISGMTVWSNGLAQQTEFRRTGKANQYQSTSLGHEAPGIVTDLGQGRALLHCYPVPPQGQLKVALAITVPLKLHTLTDCSLPLPKFINTNFGLNDGEHEIRVISSDKLSLSKKGITSIKSAAGYFVVSGRMPVDMISGSGIALRVTRPDSDASVVAVDDKLSPHRYITQTIKKLPAQPPKQLVVVLDGSESMKPHVARLQKVIDDISAFVPTSVIVAGRDSQDSPIRLNEGKFAKALDASLFEGGKDNLHAIVKATEIAGETRGGAVVWIHGPQPSFNKEIYIMSPFAIAPSIYELSLDKGNMDAAEYFKHHREIGIVTPIARNASPAEDLERFLTKWRPGGHEFIVEYRAFDAPPSHKMETTKEGAEIASLFAKEEVVQLVENGQFDEAARVAINHRIVSPVSLASTKLSADDGSRSVVATRDHSIRIYDSSSAVGLPACGPQAAASEPDTFASESAGSARDVDDQIHGNRLAHAYGAKMTYSPAPSKDGYMPILQGASNGTIGPQGGDATAIMGVNTAGTVRVNNLANLEAMLNILANSVQILGLLLGLGCLVSAFTGLRTTLGGPWEKCGAKAYVMVGAFLITLGLTTPGFINYMVASARDANLFS